MVISALVLHLESNGVAQSLATHPALTLGEPRGSLLPVAAETDDAESGAALVRWLGEVPGIRFVEVVMVDFSDEAPKAEELG